ncbi:MAG: glycosyltransferase family 2 protein [Verrucomicrobiales bacterium]
MQVIFWTALLLLGYTFIGYPLLMQLLARLRPASLSAGCRQDPPVVISVSVLISAFNEEPAIKSRIENLLASDYCGGKLDIILVSDGCSDDTVKTAHCVKHPHLRIIASPRRQGKAACLNMAAKAAESDILVFTDARQSFASNTITELVRPFNDQDVVGVSGELRIAPSEPGTLSGLSTYWKIEQQLRTHESQFWSAIGCSGAIYAIRASHFVPLPADTILDDVVIPMQASRKEGRIIFTKNARAIDPQPLNSKRERMRKIRTLGGNFQMLFRYPEWLLPWGHSQWWQLISHKYLRILAPLLLITCAAGNTALLGLHPVYAVLGCIQFTIYLTAFLGLYTPLAQFRPCSLAASFVFLNAMSIAGFFYFLSSSKRKGW